MMVLNFSFLALLLSLAAFFYGFRVPHILRNQRVLAIGLVCFSAIMFLGELPEATAFNDVHIGNPGFTGKPGSMLNSILAYIEGSLGALVMVFAFVGFFITAIASISIRSKKLFLLSLFLLITSFVAFISRSMMTTYKPVIYLYPEREQKVSVNLHYLGELTVTYPPLPEDGWKVTAFPTGKIINSADFKEYSYLFWEGFLPARYYNLPSRGFVVTGEESAVFLQEILSKAGLRPVEYNEFIVFWYPQIKDYPYVQISFAGSEYEESAPLEIDPKPDSMLRVFLYFHGLSRSINIEPQEIPSFERKGFTVIEWGGTLIP